MYPLPENNTNLLSGAKITRFNSEYFLVLRNGWRFRLNTADTPIGDLEADIDQLQQDVIDIEVDIATIESDIVDIQNTLDNLTNIQSNDYLSIARYNDTVIRYITGYQSRSVSIAQTNTLLHYPFIFGTADPLLTEVIKMGLSKIASNAANFKFGIYDADVNDNPNNLLFESGTIATTAPGLYEATVPQLELTPGQLYFFSFTQSLASTLSTLTVEDYYFINVTANFSVKVTNAITPATAFPASSPSIDSIIAVNDIPVLFFDIQQPV